MMHAEEFVSISKRMFISKNPIKKKHLIIQCISKATQSALLQRTIPNFERNIEKKVEDADTNTDRAIKRTNSSGGDPVVVKTESFLVMTVK